MRFFQMILLGFFLTACAQDKIAQLNQWETYYADADKPRAHIVVVPPEGSTVPMSKLVAEYVVDYLIKRKISAVVGQNKPGHGKYFVLTGLIEENQDRGRQKYPYILRWSLSDSQGRLISSHAEGVNATQQEWDFGSPRLLNSIGLSTAGPVAQMVLLESKAKTPVDPLRQGLLVENLKGLTRERADLLTQEVRKALRKADVQVTGDPRQATFRLGGEMVVTPDAEAQGYENIRIVWRVMTMDRVELGNAVQENRLLIGEMRNNWQVLMPKVAAAAAIGVEHVFGTRSGPVPGAANRAKGAPPEIVLPGVPGRAPPPPR
ncbi:MAG: hypothetical protein COB59_12355 [Rhodospirillaceae bacterium]|nr:MAG: hypothetical protein COB59_12355 [Rhodospirillaceae bacterium]